MFPLLFLCALCMNALQAIDEKPMVVVIPSYHNAYKPPHSKTAFYEDNLGSVLGQNYSNYSVVYIVDADYLSDSDGTGVCVADYIRRHPQGHRVTLIRNKDRALSLKNWYKGILSCDDDTIVVALDGDDSLAHPDVLSRVNEMYADPRKDVWFTYGNYKFLSTGQVWWRTEEVPADLAARNAIRSWGNGPTHLKTFKAWLFKQIRIADLFYQDNFYTMSGDIAMFTPMLEMGMQGHLAMSQEVLYVYNDINPLNDHKVDRFLQIALDHHVRSLPPYLPLFESKSGAVERLKEQGLLRADVVVFSHGDREQLMRCVFDLNTKIKNYAHMYVIDAQGVHCNNCVDELADIAALHFIDTTHVDFKTSLADVFATGSAHYIAFMSDTQSLSHEVDLEHALYWLETTHAHGFNLTLDRKGFDAFQKQQSIVMPTVQVTLDADHENTVYGWRFNQQAFELNRLMNMTLYRKKDVQILCANPLVTSPERLEEAWRRSLRGTEVNLFYRGQ